MSGRAAAAPGGNDVDLARFVEWMPEGGLAFGYDDQSFTSSRSVSVARTMSESEAHS